MCCKCCENEYRRLFQPLHDLLVNLFKKMERFIYPPVGEVYQLNITVKEVDTIDAAYQLMTGRQI